MEQLSLSMHWGKCSFTEQVAKHQPEIVIQKAKYVCLLGLSGQMGRELTWIKAVTV